MLIRQKCAWYILWWQHLETSGGCAKNWPSSFHPPILKPPFPHLGTGDLVGKSVQKELLGSSRPPPPTTGLPQDGLPATGLSTAWVLGTDGTITPQLSICTRFCNPATSNYLSFMEHKLSSVSFGCDSFSPECPSCLRKPQQPFVKRWHSGHTQVAKPQTREGDNIEENMLSVLCI